MTDGAARERFSGYAGAILVIAGALLAVGLIMVTSATGPLNASVFSSSPWRTTAGRQAVFVLVGVVMMIGVARLAGPLVLCRERRDRWPAILFAGVLLCLAATLIPGLATSRHGAQRWLQLGPGSWGIGFQPSEFAKLALVIFLAWLVARESFDLGSLRRGFLPAISAVGVCAALVAVEDFGTGALLGVVGCAMILAGGCRLSHLAMSVVLGACGMVGLVLAEPYRLERIRTFLEPSADPLGAGYHSMQSLITIASGGWTGVGLGAGIQKHGYLPECATDFIFAVICEETGILGGLVVIALFVVLVWLGLQATWSASSRFERMLAFGVTATIGMQASMNIAVATVSAPTTGISLPLMSAGGSGVMMYCIAIGLLAAVAVRSQDVQPAISEYGDSGGEGDEVQASPAGT